MTTLWRGLFGVLALAAAAACSPAPNEPAPAAPQGAVAPAAGAEATLQRQREQDALLSAKGEARGPVDPAAQPLLAAPSVAESIGMAPGRVVTPALVEVLPTEPRAPRNGGSAVVLLADPASPIGAAKNAVLCRALFQSADAPGAPPQEAPRPIYWPARSPAIVSAPNGDRCAARLLAYDYPRAERIMRKLGLSGAGPFLAAERHDLFDHTRVAAVIDLSRTRADQTEGAVRYFRDRLLPADMLWAPEPYAAQTMRTDITAFLGDDIGSDLPFAPRLVRAARTSGCALTDLLDACTAPG